jgi:hypothetical protein
MTAEELALAASVFFSGLAAGFLGGCARSCVPCIVIVGVDVISNVWKTPTYKMILAWDPEAMAADWEAVRQRYFTINWIQFATTWAAFALFRQRSSVPLGRRPGSAAPASPWRGPVSVVSNSASDAVNSAPATRENIRD